jgi:Zn-dependent peptidase ImmA (M78 family)
MLSMDNLVALMNGAISKQAISKYERGLMNPRPHQVSMLAQALQVPEEYFSTTVWSINKVKFRCKGDASNNWLDTFTCTVNNKMNRYKELETILNIYPEFVNPLTRLNLKSIDQIEEITTQLRNKWQIGIHPIMSITNLLEQYGIMIVHVNVEKKEILGLSACIENQRPIIAVNNFCHSTVVRKRFTIAHELAHILLSDKAHKTISEKEFERLCERFAGSLLCPASVMFEYLGRQRSTLCMEELIYLKETYGISIAALVHRCKDLGIISQEYYSYIFENHIKKNKLEDGWGNYPVQESENRFYSLICRASAEGLLTEKETEEFSGILPQHSVKTYSVL